MKSNGKTIKHVGKGSREEMLPGRHAKAELTGGDIFQRSMNNYAKKTPSGLTANGPNIFKMGRGF